LKLIEIKWSENTHFIKKKFLEIEIVVEIEIRKLKMKLDETFFKCSILETCKIRTGIMLRSMKYLDICLEMIKKKDTSISLEQGIPTPPENIVFIPILIGVKHC
jgi:hypothetical protein